ncbi:MAG TPA: retropepsin-like aspartic protease [Terriglobales bacterium]|nr:retropepsin-like aspartic protease [Terriglobales bacterium]
MKYRVTVFVLTFLAATGVSRTQSVPAPTKDDLTIPFEVNGQFGSILIRVQVNHRPAQLLVDTGSSHTVLSAELLGVSPGLLQPASAPVKGSALRGVAGWTGATIEIGTARWPDRRVLVMDGFSQISKSMKEKVDGLMGEDLLKEFTFVVIDFRNHRLILRH